MANNRMWLRCRTCGNIFFMGKSYQDGYYTLDDYYDGKSFLKAYNDFLDKHAYCNEELNEKEIKYIDTPFKKVDSYENRFEICYEIEDKKVEEK